MDFMMCSLVSDMILAPEEDEFGVCFCYQQGRLLFSSYFVKKLRWLRRKGDIGTENLSILFSYEEDISGEPVRIKTTYVSRCF